MRVHQKQIAALQTIIKGKGEGGIGGKESNTGFYIEITKLLMFGGEASKVARFIIVCRLYLRMRMWKVSVKEQI